MTQPRKKKLASPRARAGAPAVAPMRHLDKDAWKVFARKAGAMRHRAERRRKQREWEELTLET